MKKNKLLKYIRLLCDYYAKFGEDRASNVLLGLIKKLENNNLDELIEEIEKVKK